MATDIKFEKVLHVPPLIMDIQEVIATAQRSPNLCDHREDRAASPTMAGHQSAE